MDSQTKKPHKLLVIVGLGCIVILGYLAYQHMRSVESGNSVSADEKTALTMPDSTWSEEALLTHAAAVHRTAQVTAVITIGENCLATPVVAKVSKYLPITFKNEDSEEHTITFTESSSVVIPAKSSANLSLSFAEPNRIYGYGCEKGTTAVGVVLIAQ